MITQSDLVDHAVPIQVITMDRYAQIRISAVMISLIGGS